MSRTLLFVSARFLFPVDSGGKIRTTQILRGLKQSGYEIHLASPATPQQVEAAGDALDTVCDEFTWWPAPEKESAATLGKMRHVFGPLPVSVRKIKRRSALDVVQSLLRSRPDVAVFDFAHAAVLAPPEIGVPSVMFTHNVEAEIYNRHQENATNPAMRLLWRDQFRKMSAFEEQALKRFDVTVAVADRDAEWFRDVYGVADVFVIPTGVDLDFFRYAPPTRENDIVFCGSMDWLANQDAVSFFMDDVWPLIAARAPEASLTVVGRAPPARLVNEAERRGLNWQFTGFVDDVRPYVQGSTVSILPLRIGGGTRLKVYEALAMGSPLVSTTIGVEGLPVEPGTHFVAADDAGNMAAAVLDLLEDQSARVQMAEVARSFVEQNFSFVEVARCFDQACTLAIDKRGQ